MPFSNWTDCVICTRGEREVKEHCSLLCPLPPVCVCASGLPLGSVWHRAHWCWEVFVLGVWIGKLLVSVLLIEGELGAPGLKCSCAVLPERCSSSTCPVGVMLCILQQKAPCRVCLLLQHPMLMLPCSDGCGSNFVAWKLYTL